jgi:MFS family permease
VLNGTSASLLFTPSIAAVGHFFRDRRGLATCIASTGGSVGGVVFPLMLQRLFETVGWAWAIRCLGGVCLVLCTVANFLIRSRLPPAQNASAHPDILIFRDMAFLFTTIGIFLLEFALFIPLTYITSYMLTNGFSETFAFQILPILNTGSFLGRALPGCWADSFGPFNSNMLAVLLCVIACLGVWLPAGSSTAGIVVFSLLFGFGSGTNISISPVCIGRLCKTQHYGRYYATTYTVCSFACLIGVPIAGQIITACGGDYWGLILLTGLLYCGGLVALLIAKIICVGRTNMWALF